MKRIAVRSSSVKSLGYDEERQVLELEFHSGAVYQYFSVPPIDYARLLDGRSIGRFINACIKDRYPFKQVRGAD